MAIEVVNAARTLLYDALAQNDVDMAHHKLLNLDTSNLQELGAPPTVLPPANNWLKAWDNPTHTWTHQQINFSNLAGQLTSVQQRAITNLGTISVGTWQGAIISGTYLATLSQIRQPIGDVNMNAKRLVNLANPVNPQDAVTKSFMDYLLQGLNPKTAVRVVSTVQTSPLGLPTIDGVTLRSGDRVLLTNQASGREFQNTIWIASTGSWSVAPDMDTFDEVNRAYCTVREGNVNAGTSWVQVLPQTAEGQARSFILFAVIGAGGDPGPPGPGVPAGGHTDDILVKNSDDDYDTKWVAVPGITVPQYAMIQTGALNPAGTSQAAGRMMGLNAVITTLTSTKVTGTVSGWMWNNNAAGSVVAQIRVGTGAAPHNGDPPPAGSALIGGLAGFTRLPQGALVPFSLSFSGGSVPLGVPFWIDIFLQCPNGIGVASIGSVAVNAFEIP
jgi:hypothetical protein